MNIITFDFDTGSLFVNKHLLTISSYDSFISSELFVKTREIEKSGAYYFNLPNVEWMGELFFMEIRPSIGHFSPCVFLISRTGFFFNSLSSWEKRADLSGLKNEEERMINWVRSNKENGDERVITQPPYGVQWVYTWGDIAVQSNAQTFDCGIYITWS
jgi:hypothetical protein